MQAVVMVRESQEIVCTFANVSDSQLAKGADENPRYLGHLYQEAEQMLTGWEV